MEERGGTTGVLNRRAGDWRKGREVHARLRMSRETQGLGPSTQKTLMDTKTVKDANVNVCILTNDKHNIARSRLQPNRPANRCRCLFVNAQKRGRLEVPPEAHGLSSEQREPPETCTEEAMELGRKTEREASGFGPTALRPLYPRAPSPSSSPSFYRSRREPFAH